MFKSQSKDLLVIAPEYPDKDNRFIGGIYIKYLINELKSYFKNIYVIAPVPFSLGLLLKDDVCYNYNYDNINIFFPRCSYIPITYFNKFLIDNRLKVVQKTINSNDISFDIIHAHFSWPSAYIGSKLKETYGVPLVTTIHENSNWLQRELELNYPPLLQAWKESDAIIRVNNRDANLLNKFNPHVYSIPNGFPRKFKHMDQKECKSILNIDDDTKVLFFIGALNKRKGLLYLLDSISILRNHRKDIRCYIGGEGPLKNKISNLIKEKNLENFVTLLSFVPPELHPIWINACDLFVLPSLSEGNPTVMFEALGCGRPFIGTTVGGIPEIIKSDDYGILSSPGDSKKFAEAILKGLNKQWDYNKILSYSRQFTWEKIAIKTLEIYDSSLNTS